MGPGGPRHWCIPQPRWAALPWSALQAGTVWPPRPSKGIQLSLLPARRGRPGGGATVRCGALRSCLSQTTPTALPTHWRVAGWEQHPESEGAKQRPTDDTHHREGALQGRWRRTGPTHFLGFCLPYGIPAGLEIPLCPQFPISLPRLVDRVSDGFHVCPRTPFVARNGLELLIFPP